MFIRESCLDFVFVHVPSLSPRKGSRSARPGGRDLRSRGQAEGASASRHTDPYDRSMDRRTP